jgi:hypothetical protein
MVCEIAIHPVVEDLPRDRGKINCYSDIEGMHTRRNIHKLEIESIQNLNKTHKKG